MMISRILTQGFPTTKALFNSMAYQNMSLTVWMLVVFELSVRVFSYYACIVVHPSLEAYQMYSKPYTCKIT